ncbi:class IIb bacteriocin, lactobin A/cerein 7B family [Thalassotalea eurytherma]|uniref:Class IIb bacteriocin, lactobin A/cerein 7B family n=1 Tax=Thalassotalea eurytherma TaxID=1144278 RepID=A0ABQ6H0P4_9GAMM|nr:class IIb bacteriocin, lactobin A/cerein 7B family [Thalassotalea eurytherma]GLX81705.1 hypothetical protein theurythT_11570 [Thalassotalea eurytherma]
MRELSINEVKEVNGGVLPVAAVILIVRAGQLATKVAKNKKVQEAAGIAIGAVASWFVQD